VTKWALLDAGVATAWLEYRDMTTYETEVLPQFAPPPQEYLKRGRNRVRRCIGVVCSAAKCCLWSTLLRRQTMFVTTATLCYQPRQVAAPCNASRGITCQVVVFVDVEESQWVRAISFTYLTACSSFTNSPSQCCIATVVYMIQMQADVHCM